MRQICGWEKLSLWVQEHSKRVLHVYATVQQNLFAQQVFTFGKTISSLSLQHLVSQEHILEHLSYKPVLLVVVTSARLQPWQNSVQWGTAESCACKQNTLCLNDTIGHFKYSYYISSCAPALGKSCNWLFNAPLECQLSLHHSLPCLA